MRPLRDIVRDEVFIIGSLREGLGPEKKWLPLRPRERHGIAQIVAYGGSHPLISIFKREETQRFRGTVLVVRNFYPLSEDLIYEVLSQIEEREVLERTQASFGRQNPYQQFYIDYQ